MVIKQKISSITGVIIAMFAVVSAPMMVGPTVSAANQCGGVDTSIISCTQPGNSSDATQSGIWGILLIAIGILTAGVGVAALAGIVYGIILYTVSQGDPARIKKAIEIIRNVVIGIALYAIMWSALNWLVPGGVFN